MMCPAVSKEQDCKGETGLRSYRKVQGTRKLWRELTMKHTKLLVLVLVVALFACLAVNAMAADCTGDTHYGTIEKVDKDGYLKPFSSDTYLVTPTCSMEGVIRYHCSACNNYWNVPVAKLAHKYATTYDQVKAPTCTATGLVARKCENYAVCGAYTDAYDVAALGHDFSVDGQAAKAPKCETPGCTAIKFCSRCQAKSGGEYVAPLGHKIEGAAWIAISAPTCKDVGLVGRFCQRDAEVCEKGGKAMETNGDAAKMAKNALATEAIAKVDHAEENIYTIVVGKDPTCESAGCKAKKGCKLCGAEWGGDYIAPLGHTLNLNGSVATWIAIKPATCAADGLVGRFCQRSADVCEKGGKAMETNGNASTMAKNAIETAAVPKLTGDAVHTWVKIVDAKPQTCEDTGCKAKYQCSVCNLTKGGDVTPALGHDWGAWTEEVKPSCTDNGKRVRQCQRGELCAKAWAETGKAHVQVEKVPAYGHRATWYPGTGTPSATNPVLYTLKCDICTKVLATQLVYSAADAPKGTVTTAVGVQASTASGKVKTASNPAVAKNSATKTGETAVKSTAKTTSTKSTASTASTKTAAAPATTETKKVATVAAVAAPAAELEANQAQLVADKHLYVVKNVAGEEIVLTVNVADGKITVEAALAEGESLVLYANAEAIENPTAENTLVLTANEAVELPEAFANAIVAVVKTESLPTAVATK